MDDDLLFHNKFVSDLKVPSTYNIKNKNKEEQFRQYIDKKKNIVGLNDEDTDIFEEHVMTTNPLVLTKDGSLNKERHVIERRYIYNISSKTRDITKSEYIEKEVVTGEYVKVTTNSFGEIVYEPIDIDELNQEYNALDIPNSVVNPFFMVGENMYFKSFLYRTPDEYIIDLPLMHTNVKSVRLLSTVIPCTITNINKYNNHVMIDILFGGAQILENPDFDVVFGTLIMKIPYGNYTIDQVCSEIVSFVNTFYYNNYANNTGNALYDLANMLTSGSFSYSYSAITGELYFSLAQPSNQSTIETLVIVDPTIYENTIRYDPTGTGTNTSYRTVQFPLVYYDDFLTYSRTIAAAMNYDFCGYDLGLYAEQFIVLEKGTSVYLSSLFSSFNLDMTDPSLPLPPKKIRDSLNLGASGIKSSTTGTLFAVDVTAGYNQFVSYNSTSAGDVIFTVGATTYTSSIGAVFFTNYTAFITAVVDAMNSSYPLGNFVFSTQQQLKFNDTTYVYDTEERYYIMGDYRFIFECESGEMDPSLTAAIFGNDPSITSDVDSLVHFIVISAGSEFPYTPTATTEIYFTFNAVSYIAYIPAVNYSDYDTFITAVVNAMNLTCKSGFFAFDREEPSPGVYEYYLYAANDFTMEFSSMPSIGSVMVHPPTDTDITTPLLSYRLELTSGYNAFVNPYNAYASDYSNFYLNIRQKVPDPPFEDEPGSTNVTVQVPLVTGTYSDINSLMTEIIFQLNATVAVASWLKAGTTITFAHSISDDKITISCTSTPADTYEFNIDGSLMVALASFLGILITAPTTYVTSYTMPYKYGNRLRFKMSFENNPGVSEDDQLWYMLGFRSNNSLNYLDIPWTNIFDYGSDSYYFSNTGFINSFVPSRSTEVLPDVEDKRPYRLPSMSKTNYVYLQLNNYENMYDPYVPNEKIYTKILLSEDYGKFAYDTFVDNPYVLSTTDSRLDRLQIKFIDKNANAVDFNNIDHTLTIEIVEYSDRLNANDYNTRRGYNEHSSFPEALGLGYGK